MTERDILNNKKMIEFFTNHMGYNKESLDYAIEQINNTWVDDEYRKFLGPDLRRRWKVNPSDFGIGGGEDPDPGYSEFKRFFHSFTCRTCLGNKVKDPNDAILITPEMFNENLVLYKKNKIKLKNHIVSMYTKYHDLLLEDTERMSHDTLSKINKKFPADIDIIASTRNGTIYAGDSLEQYIVKIFEIIGTKKVTKKTDFELVLSCNFADYLLSSTKEDWSSCFSLTGGCYWYGVPGLIGDKNRAFFYTTRGKRKEYLGIEVDSVVNRSWVLLDKQNYKDIVRFYPSRDNALSIKKIKEITEDDKWRYCDDIRGNIDAKHKIWPLFFDSGIYSSVSNDKCSLIGKKKDGIYMNIGDGGGTQYYMEDFIPPNGDTVSFNTCYFPRLLEKKMKASSMFVVKKCSCCNKTNNLHHVIVLDEKTKVRQSVFLCKECIKEHYVSCAECGIFYKKEAESLITHEGKNYCKTCFENAFIKCSCCDKLTHRRSLHSKDGKHFCDTCFKKEYIQCPTCGDIIKKKDKNFINVNGRDFCPKCYAKYFKTCTICGKVKEKENFKKVDNVEVCSDCYENKELVYKCRECKKKHVIKNILIIHDGADGPEGKKKKRCVACAPKLFPKHLACKKCGELWEPERLHEDGTCLACNGEEY